MNLNQSETKFSIRARNDPNRNFNQNECEVGMIRIDSVWKLGLDQSEIGLIQIDMNLKLDLGSFGLIPRIEAEWIGLIRIDFWPFFIKQDKIRFSDWFGMIRIGSDTDIGIVLNGSEWIPWLRKISLLPNISKRKIIRWLFLSKRFFIVTLILGLTYFG